MNEFNATISVKYRYLVFGLIVVFLLVTLVPQFWLDQYPKILAVIAGLFSGLVVWLAQVMFDFQKIKQIEEFRALKVKEILSGRGLADKYRPLIESSESRIWIQGVTGERLLADFAETASNAGNESKVLIAALKRNVEVKLLLADSHYLVGNDINKAATATAKLIDLLRGSNYNLHVKYYKHVPAHSVFLVDNDCLVGPIFEGQSSKHTPSIHMTNDSSLAKLYIINFEKEWNDIPDELTV